MQVIFLKNHNEHKAGDPAELPEAMANYLVRVNAAVPSTEYVEKVTVPENESGTKQADLEKEAEMDEAGNSAESDTSSEVVDQPDPLAEATGEKVEISADPEKEAEMEAPAKEEIPVKKEKTEKVIKREKAEK